MTQAVLRKDSSAFSFALTDCQVLTGRCIRHLTRNPEQFFTAVMLPIILLLLFRYLFGGAISTGGLTYINYVMAGLIVISLAFNSTATAVGVTDDMRSGIVERFRSMPLLGSAILVGHVVGAMLRNALSFVVLIAVGFAVGFRPSATFVSWLAVLGILLLFATGLSWLAVILGVVSKTVEGASGLAMILVFLPYASSALVPTQTMPGVLRGVVRNQPLTLVINTLRSLLTGQPVGNTGWIAVLWWTAILVLAVPFAIYCFRRRSAL